MSVPQGARDDRLRGRKDRHLVDFGSGGIVPAERSPRVAPPRSRVTGAEPEVQPAGHDYLGGLWRRKLTIIAAVVVTLAVSIGVTLIQHPYYEATSEVLLPEQSKQTVAGANAAAVAVDPARVLATEINVIKGPDVRAGVRAKLGQEPKIAAIAVLGADVIRITAQSADAGQSAAVANAYANAYLDLRRKQADDAVQAASRDIQSEIDRLQGQIDKASGAQQQALIQAQVAFRQNMGQLRVNGAADPGARLLASATTPSSPAGPKPIRAAIWGILLGLVIGVGIALARDFVDDSVNSKEDLEATVPSLPVLGVIPTTGEGPDGDAQVVSLTDPSSPVTEAYRSLRTAIQFLAPDHPIQALQITSPSTREGKSTTVANLGVELAEAGQRVIIVGCDLRRPRIHEFFNLDNDIGFTSVITGQETLASALKRVADHLNIFVLCAGPFVPNPAELLSSRRAAQIVDSLRDQADIVLLDCPPVLPVTDCLVVSAWADASLLICHAGRTNRKALGRSIELLHQVGAPLAGTILNAAPPSAVYGEAYEYYHPSKSRDR
ncbi:MAG: polysaccharide biosynthesis tyrosine autokinase [Actinomycetota bacterium]|nr:polysaccharide biosynthesis tyrosine autokinase [Actinomycetota bacterium]